MSYTFTLLGNNSTINYPFYPPIVLDEDSEHVLGLINFEVYNAIPNIENNKFYIGSQIISIPEGSYEVDDINKFLSIKLETGTQLEITANNNTLKCEITSNKEIDFDPSDSLGSILGFKPQKLKANILHKSDNPVSIIRVNAICIECSLTTNSYSNNKNVHILHEFFPRVPPGFKIIESPNQIIYLPINAQVINNITLKIVDQDGNLINFRGEVITVRLHLKKQDGA